MRTPPALVPELQRARYYPCFGTINMAFAHPHLRSTYTACILSDASLGQWPQLIGMFDHTYCTGGYHTADEHAVFGRSIHIVCIHCSSRINGAIYATERRDGVVCSLLWCCCCHRHRCHQTKRDVHTRNKQRGNGEGGISNSSSSNCNNRNNIHYWDIITSDQNNDAAADTISKFVCKIRPPATVCCCCCTKSPAIATKPPTLNVQCARFARTSCSGCLATKHKWIECNISFICWIISGLAKVQVASGTHTKFVLDVVMFVMMFRT